MGTFSIWHWLVVLLVILLLFGGGKISGLMGDLAKGIKSFKQNMKEEDGKDASMAADASAQTPAEPAGSIPAPQAGTAQAQAQPANPPRPAA